MPLLSLARPVENVKSAEEAKVLAVIDHLMPILADWRKAEDLRNELAEVAQSVPPAHAKLQRARSELAAAREQRARIKTLKFGWLPIALLVLGPIFGGALSLTSSIQLGIITGAVLMAIGLVAAALAASKIKQARTAEVAKLEGAIAQLDTALAGLLERKASLSDELGRRSAGFPEVKLADIRFVLKATEIAGYNALLDVSGVHDQTSLKVVDVSRLQDGLSHISEKVNSLLDVPPLLSPGTQPPIGDPVHALFGEENQLQELVGEFTVNLGKLRDISLHLPLVPTTSMLVERLRAGDLNPAGSFVAIELANGPGSVAQIQSFVDEVNQTKHNGLHVFRELGEVYKNLESVCSLYANARITSVNTIHHNLIEVLNRAAWCNRRFYCPRTVLSPKYMEDLLDVEPGKAYLLSFDDLVNRLRGDPEVGKRLNARPELEQQLSDAYEAVQDFMGGVSFDQDGKVIDEGRRPKHIEDQFQEALKRFGNALQKALTGTTYPVLNFSPEAQLFFDPDGDEWASNVSPYVYSTADTLKYGGMVKAYSDVMIPLWEHLWTEKADFRKSELFRTNESMIRMTEKESEKLIDIANQFRADMRTVREHINLIEPDLKSKYSEIISFRDGMEQLGLLSERAKESISDEKLKSILMSEGSMSNADRYETLLSTMPQAQAENRGAVHDPIDLVREPSALLTYPGGAGVRLLAE